MNQDRKTSRVVATLLAAALGVVSIPGNARADIVRLQNGHTMDVELCRFEGDMVILEMPGGGEIRASRNIIAELLPDEIPFARTVAIEALATSQSAAGPRLAEKQIQALVDRIAAKVGLDDTLARAVVKVESNYDQLAVSTRGAMGLMQIMPATAKAYGASDPFDPEMNLEAGMRYLRELLGRLDVRRALAAYNAGEGAVAKYGGIPPYHETEEYVRRVMMALR